MPDATNVCTGSVCMRSVRMQSERTPFRYTCALAIFTSEGLPASAVPVLPSLFCRPCTALPILPSLFCRPCTALPVLPSLYCPPCSAVLVLPALLTLLPFQHSMHYDSALPEHTAHTFQCLLPLFLLPPPLSALQCRQDCCATLGCQGYTYKCV